MADLAAIARAARALEGATERLNAHIAAAEAGLAALHVGVRVEVPAADGKLCFGKHGDKWKILVVSADGRENPLLGASREQRCFMSAFIPQLLDGMIEAAETDLERAEAAATKLARFVQDLEAAMKDLGPA